MNNLINTESRNGYACKIPSEYVIIITDKENRRNTFYIESTSSDRTTLKREKQIMLDFSTPIALEGLDHQLEEAKNIAIFQISKNRKVRTAEDVLDIILIRNAKFLSFTKKLTEDDCKFNYSFYGEEYEKIYGARFFVKKMQNEKGRTDLTGIQILGFNEGLKEINVDMGSYLDKNGNYQDIDIWDEMPYTSNGDKE